MSKQTRNSRSSSTAATVEKATGVQEDVGGTTSTTSDPSGLRAPDGTLSTNTTPKSGDAAGEASADPVKPQVNSDHTEAVTVEAENETPTPAVEALASGDLPKDDETADGTGANAGSDHADLALGEILDAVEASSAAEVLHFFKLGHDLRSSIRDLIRDGLLPTSAAGSSDLIGIVVDLAAEKSRLASTRAQDDDTMAGAVNSVLITSGTESVEQLLRFVELGKRIANIASLNGMDETALFARIRLVEDGSGAENFDEAMKRLSSGAIRVKADRDGYRRAGLPHSTTWQTFNPGDLTVAQVATLVDDPVITVEYLS